MLSNKIGLEQDLITQDFSSRTKVSEDITMGNSQMDQRLIADRERQWVYIKLKFFFFT